MTVSELFNHLGKDNIYEVEYAKNMTLDEAEGLLVLICTHHAEGFLTSFADAEVIDWKIVYVENNKIYIALTIEYLRDLLR